ncbi:MAG TPA: tyrosine--tRNA ligase, partial [Arenibaculum sp.]|nr:tyrosine--tRNA ligase [Arenibaculum sp.]
GAEINEAKKVLAFEATRLAHGAEAAEHAAETARRTFEEGAAAEGLPSIDVAMADLETGVPVVDLLVRTGLAASKGEARRLIRGAGARLNDAAVTDEAALVGTGDLDSGGIAKLSAGRKRHALVRGA